MRSSIGAGAPVRSFSFDINRPYARRSVRRSKFSDFVFQNQFPAFQLGDLQVVHGWMLRGVGEFRLKRVMSLLQLVEMRLNRHG
jgi:hypothetical protein